MDDLLYELSEFESGMLVLDVEAYHGECLLKINAKFGSKIHAYEPHPDVFENLCQRPSDSNEITLFKKCPGASSGLVELSDDENYSSLYRNRKGAKAFPWNLLI